jgi:predicted DsbA family dithiol-disulfide isomerase
LKWRPFQLRPDHPRNGMPWQEFARQKFGSLERANAIFANVTSIGAAEDIQFAFDRMPSAPNTLDAQRLVLFARERGREWEMVEALFSAYFSQGRNLNVRDELLGIASEVGLSADEVSAYLDSDENVAEVFASQITADQMGIEGVPFYILDERYGLSGAQPVEAFLEALDMASGVPAA